MNDFLEEIKNQPHALLNTFNNIVENEKLAFKKLKSIFANNNNLKVILTGMGSSFFASYISFYILNQHGLHAEMREAGEFLVHSFPINHPQFFKDTIIILISQSGESGEIVALVKKLKDLNEGPIIVGMTNNPYSTLANEAHITLNIKAGKENSVTSKSYVCTLLLLYLMSKMIINPSFSLKNAKSEILDIIQEINNFICNIDKNNINYKKALSFFENTDEYLEILSQGPSLASAFQATLIYKEIVKGFSEANSISMFHHGGIECLNKKLILIIISSDENSLSSNYNFIKEIFQYREYRGIIHITNQHSKGMNSIKGMQKNLVEFKHKIPNSFLSPIIEIVILQVLFYKIAQKKGIIPGKFRFSQKITKLL